MAPLNRPFTSRKIIETLSSSHSKIHKWECKLKKIYLFPSYQWVLTFDKQKKISDRKAETQFHWI